MDTSKGRSFAVAVSLLSAASVSFSLWVAAKRLRILSGHADNETQSNNNVSNKSTLPSGNDWLDQVGYDVLTSICDAIIPSVGDADLTTKSVNQAVDALHPEMRQSGLADSIDANFIAKNKAYLGRGAVEMNVPAVAADAIGRLITPTERQQVYVMLRVMSTSAGCFLVTGMPVAFQVLYFLIIVFERRGLL